VCSVEVGVVVVCPVAVMPGRVHLLNVS